MNSKTTPKDFFLHLAAMIALYSGAIALIDLAFSVINYAFPDQLANYFVPTSIVWPVSVLIVLIPLLFVLEWLIERDITKMPEKQDIWVRRWRIYLTLFLTGSVLIGDLVTLINTFLNGEISIRFVYKVLVAFVVAGIIFAHHLLERTVDASKTRKYRRILDAVGALLVIGAIVAGFMIVGSPATQRAVRFDSQRVNDLTTIQWQLVNQWQQKGALPATLDSLTDSISGFVVPHDPATLAPYEYVLKSKTSFDLCATFKLSSQDTQGRGTYAGYYNGVDSTYPSPIGVDGDSWDHSAGHACFTRTIDPSRYPVSPKVPATL